MAALSQAMSPQARKFFDDYSSNSCWEKLNKLII